MIDELLKEYNKIKKEVLKIENNKKDLEDKIINNWDLILKCKDEKTDPENTKKIIKENENKNNILNDKIKNINKKLDIKTLEKNIIYNNLIYTFINKYNNIIIDILKKYENKNIGAATEKKIAAEIKEALNFSSGYDIQVYFNINKNNIYDWELAYLDIEIKKEELINHYYNNIINLKYNFKVYNNSYENISGLKYYEIENNKIYLGSSLKVRDDEITENKIIKDPKKEALNVYKMYLKNKNILDKTINQLKDIRIKNNNIFYNLKLHESLNEKYIIDSKINIF